MPETRAGSPAAVLRTDEWCDCCCSQTEECRSPRRRDVDPNLLSRGLWIRLLGACALLLDAHLLTLSTIQRSMKRDPRGSSFTESRYAASAVQGVTANFPCQAAHQRTFQVQEGRLRVNACDLM